MQINTRSIKSRFEKSMDKYDENAIVQQEMAEILVKELVRYSNNFDSVLELGSGTGILTKKIKKCIGFKKFYANDLVEKSKKYTSYLIPDSCFIHGNALKIKVPQKMNLIISNAMFQWFSDISDIISKSTCDLADSGVLAFSTFGRENFTEIRDISGLSLNYASKDEIISKLSSEYDILFAHEYEKVLEFNTPLEMLAHMKNTGVNSLSSASWTIKDVKDFCENYMEKFDSVHLTYNPIIIIAKLK